MNDNKSIKPIVKEESDTLKLFNKWLRSNDYIPKYHSIKDVQTKMKISEAKAKEKVLNAYRYFALGLKQKGAAPDINTWIRLEIQPPEEPPRVQTPLKPLEEPLLEEPIQQPLRPLEEPNIGASETPKIIFDNNQMNQPVNNRKITFAQAYPSKIKTKVDWDAFNKKVNENYWNNRLFPITGDNVAIRYDPKYMRKDYFDDVLMKDPKKSDPKKPWTRVITQDLDHDGLNDIVIRDGKRRIRYFNGYSLKPEDENHSKQKFMLSQTADGYYGNDAYLYEYLKKTPKVKTTFETTIEGYGKQFAKILKEHYKNNRRMTLILNHLNVGSKLASIIKTYALTPVALLMTVPNLDINSVREELFKEKHSSFFIKIYKKGGEHTEQMRQNMQQLANNPAANQALTEAIQYIYQQFLELATSNPDNFVQIVETLSKSDNNTAIEWRNRIFDTALADVEDNISEE